MKAILGLVVTFSLATPAMADVLVGIEHKLSADKLQSIADSVIRAGNRSEPMQGQSVYYEITDDIMVNCSPHKPDSNGNGCNLVVNPTTQAGSGQISMSLMKPIEKSLLVQKAAEIKEKIAAADANSTDGHLHIGNPLYTLTNNLRDGTHYYCAPEGESGKKIWQCYLNVAEKLSQTR